VEEAGLVIQLRDHGKPFKPESIHEPDIHAPLKKRPSHGLGIYIMRKWMDDVRFEFSPETGNLVTLIKHTERKP
jgi:anti-sigma regulatory factor (Ser/Thr protein kinase)